MKNFCVHCFCALLLAFLSLASRMTVRLGQQWLEWPKNQTSPTSRTGQRVNKDEQNLNSPISSKQDENDESHDGSHEEVEGQGKRCKIFGPSTLQWGWPEACNHTKGGDEVCQLFKASNMFYNETRFIETARRATDLSLTPNLGRLKSRIVEAVLEDRPLTIIAMGPSTTDGGGCNLEHLRWSDALQNLSNFTGSPLPLRVINKARRSTYLQTEWHRVVGDLEFAGIDLIVIDYTVTAIDQEQARKGAVLLYTFVQRWKRPPAILFVETLRVLDMFQLSSRTSACYYAREFEKTDPFYSAAKELKLPLLSYMDIACHLPSLNRTSKSVNGAAFMHAYRDSRQHDQVHFGCGVHLILAHAIQLYVNKLLQNSCGARPEQEQPCFRSLKDFCAAGFQSTLEESKLEADVVVKLSLYEKCEMNINSSSTYDGYTFPAQVGKQSKWHLGAEVKKFGWIANEKPHVGPQKLPPTIEGIPARDILFSVHLSKGMVFLDYLATYNNIGTATCQLEDLKGKVIGPPVKINALWSRKYSLTNRVNIFASQVPKFSQDGPNAALRCREEGKKFKITGISSC